MKYIIHAVTLFVFISCATKPRFNENEILIDSATCSNLGKNYKVKISKIISDSRCPEGVNCVWEGEIQVEIAIYKNQKLEHSKTLTINYKNLEQNKQFFANYLFTTKKIKNILVLPAKQQEHNIELKDYILKVELE